MMSLQVSGDWVARSRLRALAVRAALDNIPSAAFILSIGGAVKQANARGRALLECNRAVVQNALRRAIDVRGADGSFEVSPLLSLGQIVQYLAVQQQPSELEADRTSIAAHRWQLTLKETRVLAKLVNGQSNKAIAEQIGCAERTVELHVTHILQRAEVENRSALIAKFWTCL